MKKIVLYTVLLMLFGFVTAFSQSSLPKGTENEKQSTLPADPKLSPEENARINNAGEDNPSRPTVMPSADSKINPAIVIDENAYGEANAKPAELDLTDPKLKEGKLIGESHTPVQTEAQEQLSNIQPPGEQAGTITDYRNQQAGYSEQAPGEPAKNIPDYRASSGSNTQPEGDQPSK